MSDESNINDAIEVINKVRKEATYDPEYGFDESFKNFMKKMLLLTPQSYGARIQNYIIKNSPGFKKISPALDRGDATNGREYYEIKVSVLTGSNDSLNIVQIRPWQKIDGYHIFIIDSENDFQIYHLFLSPEDMKKELKKYGTHSHIAKKPNEENEYVEWSIHIPIDEFDDFVNAYYVNDEIFI